MFECVPFLLGCLLGTLHRRARLSSQLLLLLVLSAATAATVLSGERAISRWFIVPDMLIVVSGVLGAHVAPALKRRLFDRRARNTAPRES